MQGYAGASAILNDYEEANLSYYSNQDASGLVIKNDATANLNESLKHTIEGLRNPFTDLYHWVKGE